MIIVFCGIPGSGKTTIAEKLVQELAQLGRVEMLSSDKLRGPVYRKLMKAIAPDWNRADFLVLDATFYKREWREQVSALAGGEPVVTIYLYCPLKVALERNRERRPKISEKALHIVFHKMEAPDNPTIKIDTAATTAQDAALKILDVVKSQPVP